MDEALKVQDATVSLSRSRAKEKPGAAKDATQSNDKEQHREPGEAS